MSGALASIALAGLVGWLHEGGRWPGGPPGMAEVFPGVRIDLAARTMEFEGVVPVDCHDPETPRVYLEVIVTAPDSREHEALVMTPVRPSVIHAALLAMGLRPGRPGSIRADETGRVISTDPTGDGVDVRLRYVDAAGVAREDSPSAWITSVAGGARLDGGGGGWLFAGSRVVIRRDSKSAELREVYAADATGVIVGLHCFESEVLAWSKAMSPDASRLTPEWIADAARVPPMGTPVVVRIRAAGAR